MSFPHFIRKSSLVLSTALLLSPFAVQAADFNPDLIIKDSDLQDVNSMGRGEINSFLRNKNSSLYNYVGAAVDGTQLSAAEIIYRAAQQYTINPKYLLVKLQKEQSLITTDSPTKRQLDWATGYGACDGCDTTDPKLEKFKGFGKQVDSAAGIMRWYYDHINDQGYIKKPNQPYLIDNTMVTPENMATAFLYTYTPHLAGNQNFWRLWQQWFNQVYPDGTLIKADTSPVVYVLQDGKRRAIKSLSVLVSRFNPKLLVTAPESEVNRYELGAPVNFSNYSLLRVAGTTYLLDDDNARPFASADVIKKLGYYPDEILDATQDDLIGYTMGTPITLESLYPLGRLVKLDSTGGLYYIKDGAYYSVPDLKIAQVRFPSLKVQKVTSRDFANLTAGGMLTFPDGTLIGLKSSETVYVLEKGKRRQVQSDIFAKLGYNTKNIIWIDGLIADLYPIGEPLYVQDSAPMVTTTTLARVASVTVAADTTTIPSVPLAITDTITAATSSATALPTTPIQPKNPPVIFPETGHMFTVSATDTVFIGKKKLTTPINTYLIADFTKGEPRILAGKNIDAVRPLASMTKIMTAYRLFNEGLDLDGVSTFDPQKNQAPYHYFFKIASGEQMYNHDLLNSLIVSSLNTPGRMLVQSIASTTESAFISRMNDQAKTWGLHKTFFTDDHGYDLGNESSARDYLKIFTEGYKIPALAKVMGTAEYDYTEVTDLNSDPYHTHQNSNKLMTKKNLPYTIIASKTAYLDEAGFGIAMIVERVRDNKRFVIITMGNPQYNKRFTEVDRLTKWALTNF